MTPKHSPELKVQALRWKLGLPTSSDKETCKAEWQRIASDTAMLQTVARQLQKPLMWAMLTQLTNRPDPDNEWAIGLADVFAQWVNDNESKVSAKISGLLRKSLEEPVAVVVPKLLVKPTGIHPNAGHPSPPPLPKIPQVPLMPPQPLPPPATWQWKPIPASPEPYEENVKKVMPDAPLGFRGFGARVRGKKHKHDGTNSDDWFEIGRAGPWTIIAVADGAGSKKLSRIGAKVATVSAVGGLIAVLEAHTNAEFPLLDVQAICASIHRAMQEALVAIERTTSDLQVRTDIESSLGRPAEVADLSCTLLLAVTREVQVNGAATHLVIGCQVGDGMIGAISRAGSVVQIGAADSGGHAGETEFLTSAGKLETAALDRKTAVQLMDLQALLVMTDGVADDYFPADTNLARLWGDLVVNGIPDLRHPNTPDPSSALDYGVSIEIVEAEPRSTVYLRSCETYAQTLPLTVAELMKDHAKLFAGQKALEGDTAAERLRVWLDAYHVRGSFDDRTLVVLHREALS